MIAIRFQALKMLSAIFREICEGQGMLYRSDRLGLGPARFNVVEYRYLEVRS